MSTPHQNNTKPNIVQNNIWLKYIKFLYINTLNKKNN